METDTYSQTIIAAAKHTVIAGFLVANEPLLESLDYRAMADKLGTSYGDTPYVSYWTGADRIEFTVRGPNQRDTMRTLRKAIGGKWEKGADSYLFTLEREWGSGETAISLTIEGERNEVCQKVVTGKKTRVIPARPAQDEQIVEEEEVEWVCGNLLDD